MNIKSDNHFDRPNKLIHAGLFRRLFAIFYDFFLLTALLFLTTALFTLLNHGDAIERGDLFYFPLMVTLLTITFFFFTWFWTHGGQTLGLKTWKCLIRNINGGNITWRQASIRFFAAILSIACFGLGFLWSLFHSERKTWHDILSGTEVLDLRYARYDPAKRSTDTSQQHD